jgi:hypothetical protein
MTKRDHPWRMRVDLPGRRRANNLARKRRWNRERKINEAVSLKNQIR